MKKLKKRKIVAFSIRNKILLLLIMSALPFLLIAVYLLASIAKYSSIYNSIVNNLTVANAYNISFKEEMDESLYKVVVGYVSFENVAKDDKLKDPYVLMRQIESSFCDLRNVTNDYNSRMWLDSLLRNVDTLGNRVDDIMENIKAGGKYDSNIKELDDNIYILTELIQEDIQYYIYYQTQSMDIVTEDLNKQINHFIIICAIFLIAIVIVVFVAAFLVITGILRPLWQLYDATGEVADGNFSVRTHVDTKDEVAVLSHGFNKMAENMQDLVDRVRENEQKMRKADLRLLQEQINPHFLYNTLDTIVWMIECEKSEEATEMVVALSDFFRLVLSKGKEFISIRTEEQHIRSYLQIQEKRYRDIMEYHIDIPLELYEYQIPKMTLQPIVENALYHGIKYKRSKGIINISGEICDNLIYLTVADDGVGIDKDNLEELNMEILKPCKETDRGFGLANVNERIRMYFGEEYGIHIESALGAGTKITIVIPTIFDSAGLEQQNYTGKRQKEGESAS